MISFSELRIVINKLGERLTGEEFDEIIIEAALDKNAPVQYKEILSKFSCLRIERSIIKFSG